MNDKKLETKKDFQSLMLKILNPLKSYYSEKGARPELGVTGTNYDKGAVYMEAFCRPIWGLAPFFAGGGKESWFVDIYHRGIAAGTDYKNEEYWGNPREYDQRFVEMAAIAYGILMAPNVFWNPMNDEEKQRVADYLYHINEHDIPKCNWYLFRVLVNLALKNVGRKYHAGQMEAALDEIEGYYLGHGWYKDGVTEQKDYYISFAIHFYSMLYSKYMKEDILRSGRIQKRALEFAKQFIYWFDEDGAAIPFGRSQIYRFAQISFFSVCLLCDILPFDISVMKGLIVRHLEYWMELPIFDRDHILSIGYGYPNLIMTEKYNGSGSPYWCMKAFAFLALPDDHPFWTAETECYPELPEICVIPEAEMMIRRYSHHHTMYVPGRFSSPGYGHSVEKYGKFAYDSKFAFSIAKSCYELQENCPDSMLAFVVDGYIYVRGNCEEFEIRKDCIYSKWCPHEGIVVETIVFPNARGHIRKHLIESRITCEAYECGFAVGIGDDREIYHTKERKRYCSVESGGYVCSIEGTDGEGRVVCADANTNLIHPRTLIPALHFEIQSGQTEIETEIKAEIKENC